MAQEDFFGVICYSFLWLVYCSYNAYTMINHERQLKRLQEMANNGHMYEIVLQAMSPRTFMGLFMGSHLLIMLLELGGFALAYAYISFNSALLATYAAVLSIYIIQAIIEIRRIKKTRRIFTDKSQPFVLLARYFRFQINTSTVMYLSAYGKCFVAVQLFLSLIKNM